MRRRLASRVPRRPDLTSVSVGGCRLLGLLSADVESLLRRPRVGFNSVSVPPAAAAGRSGRVTLKMPTGTRKPTTRVLSDKETGME